MKLWRENSKPVVDAILMISRISHPERVSIKSPEDLVAMIQKDCTPEQAVQAIEMGVRGQLGTVYKIDGPAILGWITELKKREEDDRRMARQMGFGGQY